MFSARMTAGLCGLLVLAASAVAQAQIPGPTLTGSVNGSTVTLSWTPVSGANVYQLIVAGVPAPIPVGNVLVLTQQLPAGTYVVAVRGTNGVQFSDLSNPVTLSVGVAPPAQTAPPTNLAALVNGTTASLSWTLPSGPLSGLVLEVVGGPFAGVSLPLSVSTSQLLGPIPAGSHAMQIKAIGAGGTSVASNVVEVVTPGTPCGGSIPVSSSAFYGLADVSWPALPGAVGLHLEVLQNGAPVLSSPFPPTATHASGSAGPGNYTVNLTAQFACGNVGGTTSFASSTEPPPGPRRAANSVSPGTLTSEVANVANQVAAAFGGDLRRSCGNNAWLFRVLNRLRAIDNRYGLNWKRGNVGDMSQDVIAYNYADVPDFQAAGPHMHAWDVISGHCGGNPGPNAQYIGNPAGQAGWTILPYMQFGYTP